MNKRTRVYDVETGDITTQRYPDVQSRLDRDEAEQAGILHPIASATADARMGVPSTADTTDNFSDRVGNIIKSHVNKHLQSAAGGLNGELEKMQRLFPALYVLSTLASDSISRIDRIKAGFVDRLRDAFAEFFKSGEEYRIALLRDPRPPQYGGLEPMAILLVLAFLLEGLTNAVYLRPYLTDGLAQGLYLSFAMSLANISLGFVSTFLGLRYWFHAEDVKRKLGAVFATVSGATGVLLNWGFAHFRNALEKGADPSAIDFVSLMLPWGNERMSLSAVALFLIGALCFAFAALKGYGGKHSAFDPRPGLTAIHQRFVAAKAILDELKQRFRESVQVELLSYRKSHIIQPRANSAANLQLMAETCDAATEFADERRRTAAEVVKVNNRQLRIYRETQIYIRGAEFVPPAYFDVYPDYSDEIAAFPDARRHQDLLADAERVHAQNLENLALGEQKLFEQLSIEVANTFRELAQLREAGRRDYAQSLNPVHSTHEV